MKKLVAIVLLLLLWSCNSALAGMGHGVAAGCGTQIAEWDGTTWNNASGAPGGTGLSHSTYCSGIFGNPIGFNIYLPPSYDGVKRFPVLYMLHGAGGTENDEVSIFVPVLRSLIAAGAVTPMIMVFPNIGRDSKTADSTANGSAFPHYKLQASLVNELIPFIDANYMTRATPAQRAISGASMGGDGCEKLAFKFPQLWSSAYCFMPANDDSAPISGYGTICDNEPTFCAAMMSTADYANADVWHYVAANASSINGLPIHVIVGSVDALLVSNQTMDAAMTTNGIAHDPLQIIPGCGHDESCLESAIAGTNFIFASNYFLAAAFSPLRAQAFVNGWGMNVHMFFGGAYGNTTNVISAMQYMQITSARDCGFNLPVNGTTPYYAMATAGINFVFDICGGDSNPPTIQNSFIAFYTAMEAAHPGSIAAVEGPNEINNFPVSFSGTAPTNAATAAGNSVLHFAATPPAILAVANSSWGSFSNLGAGVLLSDAASTVDSGFNAASQASNNVVSTTINIRSANELLLLFSSENAGPITSVTDTLGLTWNHRVTANPAGSFMAEEWYALGPSSGTPTADTITVHQSGVSYIGINVYGIVNANLSAPFDGTPVTGVTDPLTISTTHANTVIFGGFGLPVSSTTAGSSWIAPLPQNFLLTEYRTFSSNQTSLSVNLATAGVSNGGNGTIADAVVLNAPPIATAIASGTTIASATLTTVTMSAPAVGNGVANGDSILYASSSTTNQTVGWAAAGALVQQTLHDTSKTSLPGVPVINLTTCCTPWGIAGAFDSNNAHLYVGNAVPPLTRPQGDISSNIPTALASLPIWITEAGWYTNPTNDGVGVDQLIAARYQLDEVFDLWNTGIYHWYIYELYDESTLPAWGMFTSANVAKTSATAIHNLNGVMTDAGGTALTFTPTTLAYTLTGLPSNTTSGNTCPSGQCDFGGYSLLFQKSNGTYEIVLWHEIRQWDNNAHTEMSVTPVTVTVNLPLNFTTVNVYDPVTGATPLNTASHVNSMAVSLGADPLIVELIP